MTFLTTDVVDAAVLARRVSAPEHGAIATFIGSVRNNHRGRSVVRLTYTAYGAMAERECAAIVAEAEARWSVRVALRHRIGDLQVGDAAVVVAIGAGHRDEGFAACRWVIEEVKRRVPIWKHEFYADGTDAWVELSGMGHEA